jgi:hypothetical protein
MVSAIDHGSHREMVGDSAIDTYHRHDSAVATATNGFAQRERPIGFEHQCLFASIERVHERVVRVRFQPHRVDARIWTSATRAAHRLDCR